MNLDSFQEMANVNRPTFTGSNYGAAAAPARERIDNVPAEHREVFKEAPVVPKHVTYGLPCELQDLLRRRSHLMPDLRL